MGAIVRRVDIGHQAVFVQQCQRVRGPSWLTVKGSGSTPRSSARCRGLTAPVLRTAWNRSTGFRTKARRSAGEAKPTAPHSLRLSVPLALVPLRNRGPLKVRTMTSALGP